MIDLKDLDNLEHIRIEKADLSLIWEYDKKGFIVISYKENIIKNRYALRSKKVYDTKGLHKTYNLEQCTIKKDLSNFNIIRRFIKKYKDYYMGYSEGFLYLKSGALNLKVAV